MTHIFMLDTRVVTGQIRPAGTTWSADDVIANRLIAEGSARLSTQEEADAYDAGVASVLEYQAHGTKPNDVPPGGTSAQVLSKASEADFDTEWVDAGGGGAELSVEAIDALPVATSFHNGDRLIVSKGVEPATLIGTCAGVSSNPNVTIIGDASVSVDSGLNAVAFAAAIVADLDNPTALAAMKASSIDDNGDGTFEVDFYPGVFGNSIVASGSDNNPSFALSGDPGSSDLEQVDKSSLGLQDKLVSGSNIKTVGGVSLLGSGDVPVSGGGGEQMVATGVSVNMNDFTAKSDMYTVPSGKVFILTKMVFRNPDPSIFNGDSTTSLVATESATSATLATASIANNVAGNNANGILIARPSNAGVSIAAGAKLQARTGQNFGSAQTCLADAFGYLIDA